MKKLFFAISMVALGSFASCNQVGGNPSISNTKDSLSYAIGVNFGQMLKQSGVPAEDVDLNVVSGAINAICSGDSSKLTDAQIQEVMANYFTKVLPAKQIAANAEVFKNLAKENPNAISDESGILYEIIKEGDMTQTAQPQDSAMIHYTGSLFDGTVFDSSVERGEPVNFAPLQNTIPGFNIAAGKIGVGGKVKVWIPSDLAYGPQGQGPIPANANLIFEIEIISVNKAK